MFMLRDFICGPCAQEAVELDHSATLLMDEVLPLAGAVRILEDPVDHLKRAGEEQLWEDLSLEVGCQVCARVDIHYKSMSVQAGTSGTVLEVAPIVAVSWDCPNAMARAVVRRSQVERLTEALPARAMEEVEAALVHESGRDSKPTLLANVMTSHGIVAREQQESDFDFKVTLTRRSVDDTLGLVFDPCDGRLLCIYALRPGSSAARAYNHSALQEMQIQAGDYVLEVNGVRGDAKAMLKQAEKDEEVRLVLRRPVHFVVELDKQGSGILGLGLNHLTRGRRPGMSLIVDAIQENGPVTRWNESCPEQALQKGDRILAVNGFKGSSKELLNGLAESDSLDLLVSRPEGPPLCSHDDECGPLVKPGGSISSSTTGSGASVVSGSSSSAPSS